MGFEIERERAAFEGRLEGLYRLTPTVISLGGEAQETFGAEQERIRALVDDMSGKHAAILARTALVFHCRWCEDGSGWDQFR